MLPKEIRVHSIKALQGSFHPTLDALSKIYLYKIDNEPIASPFLRKQAWHIPGMLDHHLMQKASSLIVGKKDFKGLANTNEKTETIRKIHSIQINKENGYLIFLVKGDRFLYKMVRNIIGSIIFVGLEKITLTDLKRAITTKTRRFAGPCAPSKGLYLKKVLYPLLINKLLKNASLC